MLEFNLFLIDHWYYSVPLIASIFLWFFSESRRGGARIEPHNLTTMVNKEDAMIVDLRSKEEFDSGSITGSLSIPYKDCDKRYEELLPYKDNAIIMVCGMGRNAAISGEKLKKFGFANISILKGGISKWQEEGLPLV